MTGMRCVVGVVGVVGVLCVLCPLSGPDTTMPCHAHGYIINHSTIPRLVICGASVGLEALPWLQHRAFFFGVKFRRGTATAVACGQLCSSFGYLLGLGPEKWLTTNVCQDVSGRATWQGWHMRWCPSQRLRWTGGASLLDD